MSDILRFAAEPSGVVLDADIGAFAPAIYSLYSLSVLPYCGNSEDTLDRSQRCVEMLSMHSCVPGLFRRETSCKSGKAVPRLAGMVPVRLLAAET